MIVNKYVLISLFHCYSKSLTGVAFHNGPGFFGHPVLMRCWVEFCLSAVQMYSNSDATTTSSPSFVASLKYRMAYLSGICLPRCPEKEAIT